MRFKHAIRILTVVLMLAVLIGTLSASAGVPYSSYTYSYGGNVQLSPAAYVPQQVVNTASLLYSLSAEGSAGANAKIKYANSFTGLDSPTDIFVDDLNEIYISNTGKNEIVVIDKDYNVRLVINSFMNSFGVPDALNEPRGLFVTESEIFVADSANSRIVVFDKVGNFVDIVPEPASEVMPENHVYRPIAVSVDSAGRIYVVSSTTNYGVISINRDGSSRNTSGRFSPKSFKNVVVSSFG